jgi:hypothetical protein
LWYVGVEARAISVSQLREGAWVEATLVIVHTLCVNLPEFKASLFPRASFTCTARRRN